MSILAYSGGERCFSARLSVYPGGEVRFRRHVKIPSKGRSDSRRTPVLPVCLSTKPVTGLSVFSFFLPLLSSSPFVTFCLFSSSPAPDDLHRASPGERSPLVNSSEFHPTPEFSLQHSKNGTSGYGALSAKCSRFTSLARNTIRWSASALEQFFGRSNCVFLTGTLPGSTVEACEVFARYSSWIMDRLQKWLRKHFSIDCSFDGGPVRSRLFHLGVWELQTRGALHYHALVATQSPRELIDKFHPYWIRLLSYLSDATGVDLFARRTGGSWRPYPHVCRADAQVVVKSCSSYLAKYLGKSYSGSLPGLPPARWWACTRSARDCIDLYKQVISFSSIDSVCCDDIDEFVGSSLSNAADFSAESLRSIPSLDELGLLRGFTDVHSGWIGFFNGRWLECLSFFDSLSSVLSSCVSDQQSLHRSDYLRSHSLRLRRRWYDDVSVSIVGGSSSLSYIDWASVESDHARYHAQLSGDECLSMCPRPDIPLRPVSLDVELEPSQLELF